VVVGAALAQPLTQLLGIRGPTARPLAGILLLIVGAMLGSSAGFSIGEPLRRRFVRDYRNWEVDRAGGAIFSGVAVLVVAWFLGLSFALGPIQSVARLIQHSVVLRAMDAIAPRPPGFMAGVEGVLAGVPVPPTFAGFEPFFAHDLPLPASVDTPGIIAAQKATVKIEGRGCGGFVTGSGFPVGSDLVLTNAHVVSGTTATTVVTHDRRILDASVVLFDPNRDVAILRVPGLAITPLATASAGRGTQGAVIGYPGGGPEQVGPAVVAGSVNAQGRDIYNQNLVNREIWVLEATVQPGNSGGPVVNRSGNLIGVVFAASVSQPDQAYALTVGEVAGDIGQGQSSNSRVDTSAYACAV
jgi:S1-C subfamily serine protease